MPATKPYETKMLGEGVDATAPDGTAVRLLLSLAGGSMAHFELPAGAVSHAITHRTVEEIWFVVSGRGAIWRRQGDVESIDPLGPGTSLTIPLGAAFQFRAASRFGAGVRRDHHAPLAWHGRGRGRAGPVVTHRRGRLAVLLRAARLADSGTAA
jgi:mannose-6-phosphate isomerase-like protein (cupin superfamily)